MCTDPALLQAAGGRVPLSALTAAVKAGHCSLVQHILALAGDVQVAQACMQSLATCARLGIVEAFKGLPSDAYSWTTNAVLPVQVL
jgi:hypothetical protein